MNLYSFASIVGHLERCLSREASSRKMDRIDDAAKHADSSDEQTPYPELYVLHELSTRNN